MRVSYRKNTELGYGIWNMEWNGIVNARSKQSNNIYYYYYYYYCFQYLGNGDSSKLESEVSQIPQVPQPPESHLPVRLHEN